MSTRSYVDDAADLREAERRLALLESRGKLNRIETTVLARAIRIGKRLLDESGNG